MHEVFITCLQYLSVMSSTSPYKLMFSSRIIYFVDQSQPLVVLNSSKFYFVGDIFFYIEIFLVTWTFENSVFHTYIIKLLQHPPKRFLLDWKPEKIWIDLLECMKLASVALTLRPLIFHMQQVIFREAPLPFFLPCFLHKIDEFSSDCLFERFLVNCKVDPYLNLWDVVSF